MQELRYCLKKGDSLNRWFLSSTKEEVMNFIPDIMGGEVDTQCGFMSHHKYPCRDQFVKDKKDKKVQKVSFVSEQNYNHTYFPFENPRVEYSGFWFIPTYLSTWGKTYIDSPRDQSSSFLLQTCGGIKIWVNAKKVLDFIPYTRNTEQSILIDLPLKAGRNEIVVFFDDLAERDTLYYFRLLYEGEADLEVVLPIRQNAEVVRTLERLFQNLYLEQDTIQKGPVKIYLPFPSPRDLKIKIQTSGDYMHRLVSVDKEIVLEKGSKVIDIGDVNEFPMGYMYITVAVNFDGIVIKRKLRVEFYQEKLSVAAAFSLEERKTLNLEFIAHHGELIAQRALAMLKENVDLEKAKSILLESLQGIKKRQDCSDFYLIAILWLYHEYRDKGIFDEKFWNEAKDVILGFRYWVDEPGNDCMWYFSENHALLFHASELLAGQIFSEETFTNSGVKGELKKEKAESRLLAWFDRFFEVGFAEWNSTVYIPIDLAGFFVLYELAESEILREKAKAAIDKTFYLIAMNSHYGNMACSQGRVYEKELKGRYIDNITALCWTAWGCGYLNQSTIAQTFFCLSSYQLPAELASYPDWHEDKAIILENSQGEKQFVNLYLYKNKYYLLNSANNFKIKKKGFQEHILQATFTYDAHFWVNHPGEKIFTGVGRPSYWAGNGYLPKVGQYKNLALALYEIEPEHDAHFTHAYFPLYAFDAYRQANGWWFVKKNDAYGAIYAQNGLELVTEGQSQYRELISKGLKNYWIIKLGCKKEFGDFETFVKRVSQSELKTGENGEVNFVDPQYGLVSFSWGSPLTVNCQIIAVENRSTSGKIIYETL